MKISMLLSTAILLAAGSLQLSADDDEYKMFKEHRQSRYVPTEKSVDAKRYDKECASCHMAYQPSLLPKRSWEKVMNTLADHFNTDATLDPTDHTAIAMYLAANAADVQRGERHMAKIADTLSPDYPMNISKSSYFIKEHRKIPPRYITQPEVKSIANCNACHTTAEQGNYGERGIRIPNYGRWDD